MKYIVILFLIITLTTLMLCCFIWVENYFISKLGAEKKKKSFPYSKNHPGEAS